MIINIQVSNGSLFAIQCTNFDQGLGHWSTVVHYMWQLVSVEMHPLAVFIPCLDCMVNHTFIQDESQGSKHVWILTCVARAVHGQARCHETPCHHKIWAVFKPKCMRHYISTLLREMFCHFRVLRMGKIECVLVSQMHAAFSCGID